MIALTRLHHLEWFSPLPTILWQTFDGADVLQRPPDTHTHQQGLKPWLLLKISPMDLQWAQPANLTGSRAWTKGGCQKQPGAARRRPQKHDFHGAFVKDVCKTYVFYWKTLRKTYERHRVLLKDVRFNDQNNEGLQFWYGIQHLSIKHNVFRTSFTTSFSKTHMSFKRLSQKSK